LPTVSSTVRIEAAAILGTGRSERRAMSDENEHGERQINITPRPSRWPASTRTSPTSATSDYEFTITFARVDHEIEDDEVPGVVVSRVALSPRFLRELIDALEDNYSKWSTREGIKSLPEYPGE
jgi:hypothetical protein